MRRIKRLNEVNVSGNNSATVRNFSTPAWELYPYTDQVFMIKAKVELLTDIRGDAL